jgi:hypothetical protein
MVDLMAYTAAQLVSAGGHPPAGSSVLRWAWGWGGAPEIRVPSTMGMGCSVNE